MFCFSWSKEGVNGIPQTLGTSYSSSIIGGADHHHHSLNDPFQIVASVGSSSSLYPSDRYSPGSGSRNSLLNGGSNRGNGNIMYGGGGGGGGVGGGVGGGGGGGLAFNYGGGRGYMSISGGGELWVRGPILGSRRVRAEHEGKYTCVTANSEGTDKATYTVRVLQELVVEAHPRSQVSSSE